MTPEAIVFGSLGESVRVGINIPVLSSGPLISEVGKSGIVEKTVNCGKAELTSSLGMVAVDTMESDSP